MLPHILLPVNADAPQLQAPCLRTSCSVGTLPTCRGRPSARTWLLWVVLAGPAAPRRAFQAQQTDGPRARHYFMGWDGGKTNRGTLAVKTGAVLVARGVCSPTLARAPPCRAARRSVQTGPGRCLLLRLALRGAATTRGWAGVESPRLEADLWHRRGASCAPRARAAARAVAGAPAAERAWPAPRLPVGGATLVSPERAAAAGPQREDGRGFAVVRPGAPLAAGEHTLDGAAGGRSQAPTHAARGRAP